VTAYPWPMSTTPAFSPMPASILPGPPPVESPNGVSCGISANCRRCTLEDL
jgi:hypothetical protein